MLKTGATPVPDTEEWGKLIDSSPTATLRDLRDRALIATLTYNSARVTAALKIKIGISGRVALCGRYSCTRNVASISHHAVPPTRWRRRCTDIPPWLASPRIARGPLFRTASGHNSNALSDQATDRSAAWRMIRRRALAAGIRVPIGDHTFRVTGITALERASLEHVQEMAVHESAHTKLDDCTKERLTQDEVERIRL